MQFTNSAVLLSGVVALAMVAADPANGAVRDHRDGTLEGVTANKATVADRFAELDARLSVGARMAETQTPGRAGLRFRFSAPDATRRQLAGQRKVFREWFFEECVLSDIALGLTPNTDGAWRSPFSHSPRVSGLEAAIEPGISDPALFSGSRSFASSGHRAAIHAVTGPDMAGDVTLTY
ncbi:MAG: hypothetical protein ACE369_08530 [Roseovarius sp.]